MANVINAIGECRRAPRSSPLVRQRGAQIATLLLLLLSMSPGFADRADGPDYDPERALAVSQAAVGRALTDAQLISSDGNRVRLSDFTGKPILISMIFTSCHHVCPTITRHLAGAVSAARDVLGEDSFSVLTIGFDTANDTPEAMRTFARQQGIDDSSWMFLSGSGAAMAALTENIGFVHQRSPRGFDHINQVTLIDREGRIYNQVYGADFNLPWLVEPLKELVFDRPAADRHVLSGLADRVRLFCTVYDPATGRYRFDYSLFVGIGIGAIIILAAAFWLMVESARARRLRR